MSTDVEARAEARLFRATAVLFAIVALVLLIALVVWALAGTLSHFYKLVLPSVRHATDAGLRGE